MKKNSKRYKEILKNSIKGKKVEPKDAIELVKKTLQLNLMSLLTYL